MKKYLFLLFLLIIYIILMLMPKTTDVLSYEDKEKDGVVTVMIDYENGINSKDLKNLFDNYNGEYYVSRLDVKDEEFFVSCSDLKKCIDDIYVVNDNEFNVNYITNGFRVRKIYFLAYKEEIEEYLFDKAFVYKVW